MKKAFLRFLSIFVIGCLFFSCNPSTGDNYEDDEQQEKEQGIVVNGNIDVKFDFSGAQALAKLEAKQDGSRAVTNADDLGDLVKILADGSMKNAITVGENCYLSDIVAIYKSPLEDSKDIFIVFNGESTLGYKEVEKQYEWGDKYIERKEIRVGQLICLHEDGSIADILKKEETTDSWNNHVSLKTDSVTFDAAGNVYFISSDNGDMIYQYNPKTSVLAKMVAAVEGTNYQKMQIDDAGQWIFVSGSRYVSSSSYFLRAIPISNPNGFVNIYYSSNNNIGTEQWTYDNRNEIMYFIVNDGSNEGLFTASKNAGFKTKEFIGSKTKIWREFNNPIGIFNMFISYYSDYEWLYVDEESNFSPSYNVDVILNCFSHFFYGYKSESHDYDTISLTRDEVDIRFDSFSEKTGQFKLLYNLTKGKKNEELFEALNCWEGKAAMYEICYDVYYRTTKSALDRGFIHNFLADIVYVKDTDILLCDYDEVILSYYDKWDYLRDDNGNIVYDENGNDVWTQIGLHEIKGKDFFPKNEFGSYMDMSYLSFVGATNGNHPNIVCYDCEKTPSELLNYYFDFCNVDGKKEFRLTAFENDEQYSALYSPLTNEEALEWIFADVERLSLLAMAMTFDNEKGCFDDDIFIRFLSKTCFIEGSNNQAITMKSFSDFCIGYYPYSCSLFVNPTGVYYEYTDNSTYYYLVQVSDESGRIIEKIKKVDLPTGKVVRSERNNERLVLQYSIMDSNGAELGYHHIYAVDLESGQVTNCFDNVPNRNSLEVVSFNSAGDLLYYSAVRGTSVENGIVNIVTNEYNPLTVQRKMVAVYTFN